MISVGATLGTGILVILGQSVPLAGPAIWISFAIAGFAALLSAVSGLGLADQLSDRLAAQELGGEPGTAGFRRRAFADQSWHSHR